MAVWKAVDARQRARVINRAGGRRNISAGAARLALGQRPARRVGFGERADVPGAQEWKEHNEDTPRRLGIAKRGVTAFDFDAEPFAQAFKAVIRQGRGGQPRQHAHIECAKPRPWAPGQRVLPLQHGQVVVDGIAYDDRTAGKGFQIGCDLGKSRCRGYHLVRDAVNGNRRLWDWAAGLDQALEALFSSQVAAREAQGADLHDACIARIQARRFRIEDDGIEGQQAASSSRLRAP